MNIEELENIIKKGESETLELKSSFNMDAIITLVSFSNLKGGKVIFGISNNGKINGININKESVKDWLNEIKQKTEPSIIPDIQSVTIQIKIFDNSISIFNPGKLFGGITIEDLKTNYYQSRTRNKLIAEAFYLTKDIEKYGSGYLRVREAIKDYPTMNFKYSEIGNGYLVELSYKKQKISTSKYGGLNGGLNNETDTLVRYISENPGLNTNQLIAKMNVPKRTLERWLSLLKKDNKIEYHGSKKTGGYYAK